MKHSKFLTIAVASVMAFSAFALASCDDDDDPDNPGGTTSTAVVTNEALTDKLIAYYSFENGGAATDPMTGESVDYAATLSGDTTTGKSGKGIESGTTAMTLPTYEDAITIDGGVSFTYACYGADVYSDWNVLVSTDFMSLTYGNLTGSVTSYPSISSSIGVGAYAADAYAEAQDSLTTAQLASASGNSYYGYNAGCVEGSSESEGSGAYRLYTEMVGTWQYYTVTVTTDAVCFYRNGALSYCYGSDIVGVFAEYFIQDVMDRDGGDDSAVTMFSGATGTVDDVIIGSALTADEVLALYNDLSGSSKTTADVTVKSNMNEDDANKATALETATAAVKAERAAANSSVRDALLDSEKGKGVDQVGVVGDGNDLSVNEWYTTKYASASDMYTPTLNDGGTFKVVLEYYQFTDQGGNWHSASTILYNNSAEALALRQDNYGWDVGETWYTDEGCLTSNCEFNWDTYLADADGAKIIETISYDGTNLIIDYELIPIDAGATYSADETITLSDGSSYTATATIEVADSYHMTYTISGVTLTNFSFHLALESAYCEIINVTGATASEY